MKSYIFPSSIETARALILHLVKQMLDEPDRTFCMAFSGGSTPALMFDLWANEYSDMTPWERLKIFWVDERCVPPANSDSNFGMMRSLLLGMVPRISYANVFRIQGEDQPGKEALRYSKLVMREVPQSDGLPVFDVVLLGAGADGHTSSIFPGQEELLSTKSVYVANVNPNNGQKRIALTGLPILNARNIIFLITGKAKADVVWDICNSGDTGPAAYIAHHGKHVELFMDKMAAEKVCSYLSGLS